MTNVAKALYEIGGLDKVLRMLKLLADYLED